MRYYSTKYGQRSNDFGNFSWNAIDDNFDFIYICYTDDKWF